MNIWQSSFVDVNGLKAHYTRAGRRDKPALVLAHGFSDDGLCWTPVAEALQADYDIIMVDARGHGKSEGPEQGYGSAEQAGDLAGAIRALGLRQPAVLGHSMGAMTALALAGLYPDVPSMILLEDPPPLWSSGFAFSLPDRRSSLGQWIIAMKRLTREELIAHCQAQSPTWSEAELGPWADSKLRFSFNALNQEGSMRLDWEAVISSIRCPALLITADPERGALVTPESAAALKTRLPHVHIAHIAGAGHSIRRDQFARYIEVVRAFLAQTAAE
ncbi:MAG: alpha/beta hydrolase [Anaerolineae bacterium]|nr:alpha/beta hydrolase [Thermoflexales bacterium]MDW8407780.1 alpha/beta hydrolase [Anaerolineae bacterium]